MTTHVCYFFCIIFFLLITPCHNVYQLSLMELATLIYSLTSVWYMLIVKSHFVCEFMLTLLLVDWRALTDVNVWLSLMVFVSSCWNDYWLIEVIVWCYCHWWCLWVHVDMFGMMSLTSYGHAVILKHVIIMIMYIMYFNVYRCNKRVKNVNIVASELKDPIWTQHNIYMCLFQRKYYFCQTKISILNSILQYSINFMGKVMKLCFTFTLYIVLFSNKSKITDRNLNRTWNTLCHLKLLGEIIWYSNNIGYNVVHTMYCYILLFLQYYCMHYCI